MLTGREWTYQDFAARRLQVMLTSCGVASDRTEKKELVVETGFGVRRLSISESLLWYVLLFDALEYDECFCRYRRSAEHLGITPDPPDRVLMKLMKDGFVCAGAEPERPDALFSMFCSGFITRAVEQHDAIRPEKRCTYYYDRFLHWEGAEHSDCRQEPLTGDEKTILEMLAAENWTAAELARNFEKGYDASMPRYRVPRERYAILSMDPDADLVRMNYERHPSARQIAAILLNLLRSRKILLY